MQLNVDLNLQLNLKCGTECGTECETECPIESTFWFDKLHFVGHKVVHGCTSLNIVLQDST